MNKNIFLIINLNSKNDLRSQILKSLKIKSCYIKRKDKLKKIHFVYLKKNAIFLKKISKDSSKENYYSFLEKEILKKEKYEILAHSIAGLCHEIRNLLTPIILLEFIQDKVSEKYQGHIKRILNVKNQILTLINQIRCFYQSGYLEEIPIKKVKRIILESIIINRLGLKGKVLDSISISIKDKIHNPNLRINIEKNKLIQIFINLIQNARDSIEENKKKGRIKIKIQTGKKKIHMFIRNNGGMIQKKHIKKIWDPEFTTKKQGTGLGLYIVKSIIENWKGNIRCYNIRSINGCEFHIQLPLQTNILE